MRDCAEYMCALEASLDMVGGKWKALILWYLAEGALRYSELGRLMPKATPKMLTQQLRELEADRLVLRRVFPVVPPHVEYSLTDLGRSLVPLLGGLCDWGKSYLREVRGVELPICEKTGRILRGSASSHGVSESGGGETPAAL